MATKHGAAHPSTPAEPVSKGIPQGWASAKPTTRPLPAVAPVPNWKQRLLRWQALAMIGGAFLAVQIVLLLVAKHSGGETQPQVARMLALGRFEFGRPATRDKAALQGQLDVSLELADGLTAAQRRQITDAMPALQQTVEECLRRARAADFSDSRLFRLRSQLLNRLNDALSFDGVADVDVANFELK